MGANTFVRSFRDAGWRTALIGKSHFQHGSSRNSVIPVRRRPAVVDAWPEGWDALEHEERYVDAPPPWPEDFHGFGHVELSLDHGARVAGPICTGPWVVAVATRTSSCRRARSRRLRSATIGGGRCIARRTGPSCTRRRSWPTARWRSSRRRPGPASRGERGSPSRTPTIRSRPRVVVGAPLPRGHGGSCDRRRPHGTRSRAPAGGASARCPRAVHLGHAVRRVGPRSGPGGDSRHVRHHRDDRRGRRFRTRCRRPARPGRGHDRGRHLRSRRHDGRPRVDDEGLHALSRHVAGAVRRRDARAPGRSLDRARVQPRLRADAARARRAGRARRDAGSEPRAGARRRDGDGPGCVAHRG
jgi:hypothetical protein